MAENRRLEGKKIGNRKGELGPQISQTRLPLQARPPAKQGEAAWGTSGQVTRIRERETKIILISSFTIFLYSFVLEIVQIYLPYRTFNPVDIAANGAGVGFFLVMWLVFWRRRPGMALFWGDD